MTPTLPDRMISHTFELLVQYGAPYVAGLRNYDLCNFPERNSPSCFPLSATCSCSLQNMLNPHPIIDGHSGNAKLPEGVRIVPETFPDAIRMTPSGNHSGRPGTVTEACKNCLINATS